MFCANCGVANASNQINCRSCGELVEGPSGGITTSDTISTTHSERRRPAAPPRPVVIDGVRFATDEVLVRSYHCSTLRFPKCDGYLSVTSRRVIFHGRADDSKIVHEVPLDAVSGVSTFYGSVLLGKRLLLGLIAIAIAAVAIHWDYEVVGFVGVVIGVVLIALCYRKSFHLQVYSSKASASPIKVGEGAGGGGISAMYAIEARPTYETKNMMSDLGAMVLDLQTLGDLGIEKWKKQVVKHS